jgi:tRNA threonylcarbamoyladenosine biosynthesis protein TsaE
MTGGEKICLTGPLGSGKTVFVSGFAEAMGVPAGQVASPTFTLVRQYDLPNDRLLLHVDLYRLDSEDEIFEAGILEILEGDSLVLIEWADRLKLFAPDNCIRVEFSHGGEPSERTITIRRPDP